MSITSPFLTRSGSLSETLSPPASIRPPIPKPQAAAIPAVTNSRRVVRIEFPLLPCPLCPLRPLRKFLFFRSLPHYVNFSKLIVDSQTSVDFHCSSQVSSFPV